MYKVEIHIKDDTLPKGYIEDKLNDVIEHMDGSIESITVVEEQQEFVSQKTVSLPPAKNKVKMVSSFHKK